MHPYAQVVELAKDRQRQAESRSARRRLARTARIRVNRRQAS